MAIAIDAADGLALEYRRRARRLRGVYAAQPGRLQLSLRDLARRHDLRRLMEKRSVRDTSCSVFSPSSGTPAESWVEDCVERASIANIPHPNPPPEYRRRGQDESPKFSRMAQAPRAVVGKTGVQIAQPPRASETTLTEQEHRFAAVVMGQFEGPVLCFSRRKAMLDLAARLGIGKFHANFIIASVQQRLNESGNGRPAEFHPASEKTRLPWGALCCALVVQTILVATVWVVLNR
jgi:hypothetical protein